MLFTILAYGYATIDNAIATGIKYVHQRYFIIQFLLNSFDYVGRIFLLFTIYALLFRLMRDSPCGTGWLSRVHIGRYKVVRSAFCLVLGIVAILIEGFSLSYLASSVFSSGETNQSNVGISAWSAEITFELLYILAALEVLVVSSRLVKTHKTNSFYGRKVRIIRPFLEWRPQLT